MLSENHPNPHPALSPAPRQLSGEPVQATGVDLALENCQNEPIRVPESIQPHGFLVVIDSSDWTVRRVSANLGQHLPLQAEDALGRSAIDLFAASAPDVVVELKNVVLQDVEMLQPVSIGARTYNVAAHRVSDLLVVEFELREEGRSSLDTLYPQIRAAVAQIQAADTLDPLFQIVVSQIRALTGFDRVKIYRFDAQWNGRVIAEERSDAMPSYLDLRFPASDIPAQARELYRVNRIRLIPDVNYEPVDILSEPGTAHQPLDMTHCVLRSVSPVHLQYMRNMDTPASMSISILLDGKLWGLVSCHHSAPRYVASHVRAACDFLVQILGMQIAGKDTSASAADRVIRQNTHAALLGYMTREQNYVDGLLRHPSSFLSLADASGAAVVVEGECALVGMTPSKKQVTALVQWLATHRPDDDFYMTECLSEDMPTAHDMAATASGVLAISISQIHRSYVLWFRPEVVQTVSWGGDPRKREDASGKLSPRTSFETWKQVVHNRCEPWTQPQIDTVQAMRISIIGIVMRNAEEMANLSGELKRINAELEAFSYSVSHDLRAPFRHIVGYAELLRELPLLANDEQARRYVSTIVESAHTAGTLVDGLLGFSQTGRINLSKRRIVINDLVRDCLRILEPDTKDRVIQWEIGELGEAHGDPGMFRQVFQNLLSNAIKYSRTREVARIVVTRTDTHAEAIFSVADNGVGFDMRYVDKLFGVFQRLHRMEEFEGTGIGLANVKRIAQRHGGRAWAEGRLGEGATFYFSIPKQSD